MGMIQAPQAVVRWYVVITVLWDTTGCAVITVLWDTTGCAVITVLWDTTGCAVITALWDTTGCVVISKYKRFEGICCLNLHVLKGQQVLQKFRCPFTELQESSSHNIVF
jgi:hypothetical protein